jgi:hypothetical protein
MSAAEELPRLGDASVMVGWAIYVVKERPTSKGVTLGDANRARE